MAHHTQTIVVDFDDTLAFTKIRDWEGALPNQSLIDKLNHLFVLGWDIHIVTARGQISCNGDSAKADAKYRKQIEGWLQRNGVKYTSLSFQKKLALFYIDDKGCTPEVFLESFDQVELQEGWSGCRVVYDKTTSTVLKTDPKTPSVVKWYEIASRWGLSVPKIHTVIGDTIKMEYVHRFGKLSPEKAIDLAFSFISIPPVYEKTDTAYDDYIFRCMKRGTFLTRERSDLIISTMRSVEPRVPYTFSHGDFSISNLLPTVDGIMMIDPILEDGLYSSYVLDLAKLYTTALISNRLDVTTAIEELGGKEVIYVHTIGHLLRMYNYGTEHFRTQARSIIETLCNLIEKK